MKKIKKISNRIIADLKESGWAFIIFLVYYVIVHAVFDAFCPMLVMTGIPCPGCGLTRAVIFLARGQVLRAAYINPSVFPLIGFLLYCGYFRYVKGSRIKGSGVAVGLLTVCMLVIYGCRMYLYFPDRAPYVYMENNMAARWIPGYGSWVNSLWDLRKV